MCRRANLRRFGRERYQRHASTTITVATRARGSNARNRHIRVSFRPRSCLSASYYWCLDIENQLRARARHDGSRRGSARAKNIVSTAARPRPPCACRVAHHRRVAARDELRVGTNHRPRTRAPPGSVTTPNRAGHRQATSLGQTHRPCRAPRGACGPREPSTSTACKWFARGLAQGRSQVKCFLKVRLFSIQVIGWVGRVGQSHDAFVPEGAVVGSGFSRTSAPIR